MPSLFDMPNELVLMIAESLDYRSTFNRPSDDIIALSTVCKKLREITASLWRRVSRRLSVPACGEATLPDYSLCPNAATVRAHEKDLDGFLRSISYLRLSLPAPHFFFAFRQDLPDYEHPLHSCPHCTRLAAHIVNLQREQLLYIPLRGLWITLPHHDMSKRYPGADVACRDFIVRLTSISSLRHVCIVECLDYKDRSHADFETSSLFCPRIPARLPVELLVVGDHFPSRRLDAYREIIPNLWTLCSNGARMTTFPEEWRQSLYMLQLNNWKHRDVFQSLAQVLFAPVYALSRTVLIVYLSLFLGLRSTILISTCLKMTSLQVLVVVPSVWTLSFAKFTLAFSTVQIRYFVYLRPGCQESCRQ